MKSRVVVRLGLTHSGRGTGSCTARKRNLHRPVARNWTWVSRVLQSARGKRGERRPSEPGWSHAWRGSTLSFLACNKNISAATEAAATMGGLGLWGGWQIVTQARAELRSDVTVAAE
jgi:hypothetical protein